MSGLGIDRSRSRTFLRKHQIHHALIKKKISTEATIRYTHHSQASFRQQTLRSRSVAARRILRFGRASPDPMPPETLFHNERTALHRLMTLQGALRGRYRWTTLPDASLRRGRSTIARRQTSSDKLDIFLVERPHARGVLCVFLSSSPIDEIFGTTLAVIDAMSQQA